MHAVPKCLWRICPWRLFSTKNPYSWEVTHHAVHGRPVWRHGLRSCWRRVLSVKIKGLSVEDFQYERRNNLLPSFGRFMVSNWTFCAKFKLKMFLTSHPFARARVENCFVPNIIFLPWTNFVSYSDNKYSSEHSVIRILCTTSFAFSSQLEVTRCLLFFWWKGLLLRRQQRFTATLKLFHKH